MKNSLISLVLFEALCSGVAFAERGKPGGALEYDATTGNHHVGEVFRFLTEIVGQAKIEDGSFDHVYWKSADGKNRCSVFGRVPVAKGYPARKGRLRTNQRAFIIYGGPDSPAYKIARFDVRFEKAAEGYSRYLMSTTQLVFTDGGAATNFNVHCESLESSQVQPSEALDRLRATFLSTVLSETD